MTDQDSDPEHGPGPTHDHHHADPDSLGVGLLTISTSRTLADDEAGDAAVSLLEAAGHEVATRELVPDEHDRVQNVVDTLVNRDDVDCVVTSGGTGITPDDITVQAVRPLLDRELPGFGELFRAMSREEVGTRAILSRATAGVADGVPVFVLPGSENAVRLAVSDLILPEAPHLVGMATRSADED
ncbi:MAG: molybdenum cofactor biosynthesis protein B [Halobacteriaceae archaeon]